MNKTGLTLRKHVASWWVRSSYANTYRCLPLWILFLPFQTLSGLFTSVCYWYQPLKESLPLLIVSYLLYQFQEISFSSFCVASCQCLPLARLCASTKGRWWPWWGHETSVAMLVARDGERKWCCPIDRWVGSHVLLPPDLSHSLLLSHAHKYSQRHLPIYWNDKLLIPEHNDLVVVICGGPLKKQQGHHKTVSGRPVSHSDAMLCIVFMLVTVIWHLCNSEWRLNNPKTVM